MKKNSFPTANFLWNGIMAACSTVVVYKYGAHDVSMLMLFVWLITSHFYYE